MGSTTGGIGSVLGYIFTFLATLAALVMIAVIWNYYINPGRAMTMEQHYEFVSSIFAYILILAAIVVLGEMAYKAPRRGTKKRNVDEDGLPPYKV